MKEDNKVTESNKDCQMTQELIDSEVNVYAFCQSHNKRACEVDCYDHSAFLSLAL